MGCTPSKQTTEAEQDAIRNKEIDTQIKQAKADSQREIKLLLLGAGESGKSTVLKQMKLIHDGGYSQEERDEFKEIIYSNTVQSMHVILEAMEKMQVPLEDQAVGNKYRDIVWALPIQVQSLSAEVTEAIRYLWKDKNLQSVYDRNQEYQLNDSAKYFFDSIDRIGDSAYSPTDQDVLRARVKTTGITETTFRIGEFTYRMFDLGGQRSERKKWIHCFENVMAIIFMVALSEFDQVLIEDEHMNRMKESLLLFDSICNSKWFKKTSIILFLNKIDIFREKIEHNHLLSDTFPEYKGANTYQETSQYLMQRFLALNKESATKQIYTHFTCATDTAQMEFVMNAINDIIIQNNLRDVGLL
ncbi:hypothetical protein MBANPS3_006115 [Mucor bainieri]